MCEKKTRKHSGKNLSLCDFFDPSKPWDLREFLPDENSSLKTLLKYLPKQFTEGRWNPFATIFMFVIACLVLCLTIDANIKYHASNDNGVMEEFVSDELYPAFTMAWYYNLSLFLWMSYVCWKIHSSYSSFVPWITFTLWSWTIMCIRHGLCVLAPFIPSFRLLIGVLRFPVLLSSSVTFGIWNFILLPVIAIGLVKGKRRSNFLRFAFKWTMCQIHILNILYAYMNCIWAEPSKKALHLGDVNAGVTYIMLYLIFYYFILDRIGAQLYPIFSPRSYISIPSLIMVTGICVGTYNFWNEILSANE